MPTSAGKRIPSLVHAFRSKHLAGLAPDGPGFAFLVKHDGRLVHEEYRGMASLENGIPIRAETTFNIASISKLFTATAVMRLWEDGRLALDDTLGRHAPELAPPLAGLRVDGLLSHTSGLSRLSPPLKPRPRGVFGNADVIESVRQHPEDVAVENEGEFKYSNFAYILLSHLVERVSGTCFPEFVETAIFEPLGMTSARLCTERKPVIPHRANAYGQWPDGAYAFHYSPQLTVGDGGIYVNAGDLVRFCEGGFEHRLLRRDTVERMVAPRIRMEPDVFCGLGWRIRKTRCADALFHTGTDAAFASVVACVPAMGLTIALLSNFASYLSKGTGGGIRRRMIEEIAVPLGEEASL